MKIKCLRNFTGAIAGRKGTVVDVQQNVADDLIQAGYAVALEEQKVVKASKPKTKAKGKA